MDRFTRTMTLSACGFGLLLGVTGCKLTRPEVPPGRSFSNDGRQRPAIGFSSEGHPVDGSATTNLMPDTAGNSKLANGIGAGANRPDMSTVLGGGSGSFGPPGTSGRDEPGVGGDVTPAPRLSPAGDEAVLPAGSPALSRPSINPNPGSPAGMPPASAKANETLPADTEPQADLLPPASQVTPQEIESPGKMGRSNDLPSPN